MKKVTLTLYSFNELNEQAQQKAIERLEDINVSHNWDEHILSDAKEIGLEITSYNINENCWAKGDVLNSCLLTAMFIMDNHGDESGTYKLADKFLKDRQDILENKNESKSYIEKKLLIIDGHFTANLLDEYAEMLESEYDYQTSKQAIIKTIGANDYTFEKDGTLNNGNSDNYEQEGKSTLRSVNEKLYDALNELWKSHIENEGTLDYPEKDRAWISDTLDLIEIKYFGQKPDGDPQKELSEDGTPMFTDSEAFNEMLARFNNTNID